MSPHRKHRQRGLTFERLDARECLAGSVTATVNEFGGLVIIGDAKNNVIAVWKGANPGQVVIAGGKDPSGAPTQVNGSLAPITLSGVKRVFMDLREANDKVLYTNLSLPNPGANKASISGGLGTGNDTLILRGNTPATPEVNLNQGGTIPYGPAHFTGGVVMNPNTGHDAMRVFNVTGGGVSFYGGDGNDVFQVDGISPDHNHMGAIHVDMGLGDDHVRIRRVRLDFNLTVLESAGGTAGARVELFDVHVLERLDVTLRGPGSRLILDGESAAADYSTAGSVSVLASNVFVRHTDTNSLQVITGSANDKVEIVDAVFNFLEVQLNDGDDLLKVGNVTVNTSTKFNGGADTDTFDDAGGNSFAGLSITNFEIAIFEA